MSVRTTIDNGTLTITVTGHPPILIDPTDYPPALNDYAALHGFKQRYVDAAALGADATDTDKYKAILALVDHHRATGEWSRVGTGTGTGGSDGLLIRALMEYAGIDRDTARTRVAPLDRKTQDALRRSPELAPIIARLRTAKPPTGDAAARAASVLTALVQGA